MINTHKMQLMAILNCTPDSFYDGGCSFEEKKAIEKGMQLFNEGADIIDVGGESTRPGSTPVSTEEEIKRTQHVIKELHKACKVTLSIDTYKPEVAEVALKNGASFINDVTGFQNPSMITLAKEFDATICVMHNKPHQHTEKYAQGVVKEVYEWFEKRIEIILKRGIDPKKIYLDVGIGFGKNVEENLLLIKNIAHFKQFGFGLLIGLSRKSFMQKILQKSASEVLSTTLALNTMSLFQGVDIIRIHDVKEHKEIITLLEKMKEL